MTLNLTTRRHVAVRSRSLTVAGLFLGLMLAGVSTATAQHAGGGGRSHGMGGEVGGGMRENGFRQPMSQQPRPRTGLQLGLGGRWWDEHKTIKKLNLSSDQQHHMDSIFEANKPTLINLYSNLQREEAHLVSLPAGDLQDETKVFAAIDRVSLARSDLEKENAHILLQIRQQLGPQQLQTLDREIASSTSFAQ